MRYAKICIRANFCICCMEIPVLRPAILWRKEHSMLKSNIGMMMNASQGDMA